MFAAQSAVTIYRDQVRVGTNLRLNIGINLADIATVAHVLTKGTDGNSLVRGTDGAAGEKTQGDIVVAGTVTERTSADGRVAEACCVVEERPIADSRVGGTHCIAKKRSLAVGRVKAARDAARLVGINGRSGIAKQGERPRGCVLDAGRIT
jgi:hypothetical protein